MKANIDNIQNNNNLGYVIVMKQLGFGLAWFGFMAYEHCRLFNAKFCFYWCIYWIYMICKHIL